MFKEKNKAILFTIISVFFLLSFFVDLELIPLNWLLLFFGLPKSDMGFFLLLFYLFISIFIIHIIFGIYASVFPEKRKLATNKFLNRFKVGCFGILVIAVTFFSIIIISILKTHLLPLSISQLVNLYLFWFFALRVLKEIIPIKVRWQGYR